MVNHTEIPPTQGVPEGWTYQGGLRESRIATGRRRFTMKDYQTLSHTTWDSRFHVVYISKCRRQQQVEHYTGNPGRYFPASRAEGITVLSSMVDWMSGLEPFWFTWKVHQPAIFRFLQQGMAGLMPAGAGAILQASAGQADLSANEAFQYLHDIPH